MTITAFRYPPRVQTSVSVLDSVYFFPSQAGQVITNHIQFCTFWVWFRLQQISCPSDSIVFFSLSAKTNSSLSFSLQKEKKRKTLPMPLGKSFLSRKISRSLREPKRAAMPARLGLDSGESSPSSESDQVEGSSWSSMLPELLGEIIQRVEASEDRWPQRQSVVACACVCKKWREITKEMVRSPVNSGKITFPSCLKLVNFCFSFYTTVSNILV